MQFTIDSLFQEIPNKEFADSLFSAVNTVSRHTDNLQGFSGWVTWTSFIASIITIIGILLIGLEIYNRRTTKKCQERIILDLIRHFFTNNAISEAIRIKMSLASGDITLKEGILQRYCVLDSDIDLGQLSYSAKNYEQLHSLRVKLRNYNITAINAEQHFTDSSYTKAQRIADLDDIMSRSIRLTNGFISFAKKRRMKLNEEVVKKYIRDYYQDEERIPKWKSEGKIDYSIQIPLRQLGTPRAYYDNQPYELEDIEDILIRERYSYVVLNESQRGKQPKNKKK